MIIENLEDRQKGNTFEEVFIYINNASDGTGRDLTGAVVCPVFYNGTNWVSH